MTKGIVIVSHGAFAEGLADACRMLCGLPERFHTVSLLPDDGPEQFARRLLALKAVTDQYDRTAVFADLKGGTPCRAAMQVFADEKYDIISGVNLPMLLEAVVGDDTGAEQLVEAGKLLIADIKKEMTRALPDDIDD